MVNRLRNSKLKQEKQRIATIKLINLLNRIQLEAINNKLKHADPSQATMTIITTVPILNRNQSKSLNKMKNVQKLKQSKQDLSNYS